MGDSRSVRARTAKQRLLDPVLYALLRGAITPVHLADPPVALHAARALGRRFARMPFNRKRVDRADERLTVAMPDLDAAQRRELVLNAYEHLAMLGVELAIAPRLITEDAWTETVELGDIRPAMRSLMSDGPTVLITGHCGNWEILGYTMAMLGYRMHALYRPLDLKPADNWVRQTRSRRGLYLLDKFGAMHQLPKLMQQGESAGFVADQNAGDRGLHVPYFGRLASSYKSIALLAAQHNATVMVGQARRLTAASGEQRSVRYRIELQDIFGPDDWAGQPDPMFYITARYRRGLEQLVRSAPEQYLWMHRIWKSRPRHERLNKPFPEPLKDKLRSLPWMTEDELAALIDRSDRDRAMLAELGVQQMP
ncbi:MAG: lysophospholipid acyltransferase family protein [Phycisphaerales bacterium]|nr:lysophospholipid acyltransferase family protein [Planctomycetota bacterium]MCH8509307.1 lysophospholipid acyltransferase family protein [Phycisphaerales bacterium]